MIERHYEPFLGVIPLPRSGNEQVAYDFRTFGIDFNNESFKQSTLGRLCGAELVLKGERWPSGEGRIAAFLHPKTGKLIHLCLGRIITDEATEEQVYLGLRYSPQESPFMRFDAWPPQHTPLKTRIPGDHLVTGMPRDIHGYDFLMALKSLGFDFTKYL